jgi:hypothetical protein
MREREKEILVFYRR